MNAKLVFLLLAIQLTPFVKSNDIPDLFAQPSELGKCVSSCRDFPIKMGNKLYHIESTLKVNWFTAAESCRKWGGHLLNIESSSEIDMLLAIVPSNSFWTSSNCLADDRHFISIASGVAMPFMKWKPGQPENATGKEYCVQAAVDGLSDEDCDSLLNYVCQANILY